MALRETPRVKRQTEASPLGSFCACPAFLLSCFPWTCTSFVMLGGVEKTEAYRLLQAFRFNGKQVTYREKTDTSEAAEAARHDPLGFYNGVSVERRTGPAARWYHVNQEPREWARQRERP
jgi:hypothetical protein